MAEVLFITRQDLVRYTTLNGNVDTDKFIQYIKIAQDIHIQNYLGTDLFNKLKDEIQLSQSGIVTGVNITNAGTGYTTDLTNVSVTGGNGSGFTVDYTTDGDILLTAIVNEGGLGYKLNNVLTIASEGNGDAELTVTSLYDIPADYKNLLETYVKPMLIHWAMVEYLPFAAYTIANKGVYKHGSENAENVDKNEIDFLVNKERSIAEHYTERFINFMNFNQIDFPEYNTNSNGDMFPDDINNYGGWIL